ncbi:IS701 family transposase [Herbidospora mongoliensis]|uniref:IS701 family transposase n=1 Tax=Herbidospora mongoliensis TaxID=688067 RepID=UPI000A055449|nr:IS701 family transposase [Herbidospora mongoliensis]
MTKPKPCPPAPGPLEEYAARFDDLFSHVAQRRGFREYLAGLLQPRSRNKTLTCLADAEPVAGAGSPPAQRLQFFLSESCWDPDRINERRLRLLLADPATAAHAGGVLVIDDSGDRKDGTATAFAGRQWLGRLGKTDNGIVTVTSLWADERLYFPLHAQPYTPARRLPGGKNDPAFRTKWQIAVELAAAAIQAGVGVRAAVADCAYGDLDNFRAELRRIGLAWVMALRARRGTWAYGPGAYTPREAARELGWAGPDQPGDWQRVERTFRDGHTETWWAGEARLGAWGPDGLTRLVVATADPATLPDKATWYLATNLPRPGSPRTADSPHQAADLAELVRLYGIRNWIEQSYKQIKDELGWADFQVRSDIAIRRHQALVNCAFSFCWAAWFADPPPPAMPSASAVERGRDRLIPAASKRPAVPLGPQLAPHTPRGPKLADPGHCAHTLVAGMVQSAPAR